MYFSHLVVPWAPVPVLNSSISLSPPPRPNFGQVGRPIGLRANHFQVLLGEMRVHVHVCTCTPCRKQESLFTVLQDHTSEQNYNRTVHVPFIALSFVMFIVHVHNFETQPQLYMYKTITYTLVNVGL